MIFSSKLKSDGIGTMAIVHPDNRPPAKLFAQSFNINHFEHYQVIIKD